MYKIFLLTLLVHCLFFEDNIFPQDLIINTYNNLDFGDVYIGYSSTISHTDAGAAKFRIDHSLPGNKDLQITFTLPSSLRNGIYSVPILFSSTYSAYSLVDIPTGRTNFNPNVPLMYYKFKRNQFLYTWLGGSINVPTNIVPGIYTATITVTVVII
jgi:hypothetical protein